MKKLIVAVVALFALSACQTPDLIITNNNENNNHNSPAVSSPGSPTATQPGAPQVCNPVHRVVVSAPSSLHVGETARLDATPLDVAGNRRPESCDLSSGVSWSVSGSSCSVDTTGDFNPILTARSVGRCQVGACVSGVCSDSRQVEVIS